jgi:hypothetical protein
MQLCDAGKTQRFCAFLVFMALSALSIVMQLLVEMLSLDFGRSKLERIEGSSLPWLDFGIFKSRTGINCFLANSVDDIVFIVQDQKAQAIDSSELRINCTRFK